MNRWLYGKWGILLRRAAAFLRDAVYPEGALCLGCGKISDGTPLCPACRRSLLGDGAAFSWTFTDLPSCPAWSLRPHEGLPRRLVLSLKHRGEACLAREMAALVLPLPAFLSFSPDTVVTWVTMPRRRERVRGIDHGRLLAEAVAENLGLPCRKLLNRRNGRYRTRATLNAAAREANLEDAFSPVGPVSFPVLLVDDVLTTGTTVRRCVSALRKAGAKDVTALTFTKAVRGSSGPSRRP